MQGRETARGVRWDAVGYGFPGREAAAAARDNIPASPAVPDRAVPCRGCAGGGAARAGPGRAVAGAERRGARTAAAGGSAAAEGMFVPVPVPGGGR